MRHIHTLINKTALIARPFYWREACLCVPAIPLILFTAMAFGQTTLGTVAAGAAFSVGMGAARDFRGRRWAPMIWATFGMGIATFLGSLTGSIFPLLLFIAVVSSAICAALALYDEDMWWIWLQLLIALLVAGNYGSSADIAASRSAAVILGGTVQITVAVSLARLWPRARHRLPPAPPQPPPTRKLIAGHMLRAVVCVALTYFTAHRLGFANSYWAPMTAILILKPGLHETRLKGIARLGGTLLGCGAATAFAMLFYSIPTVLVAGIAAAAGLAFAFQKAHYAIFTCALTATIVLLLSLANGTALIHSEHRLIATIFGGLTALAVASIVPHRPTAAT